MKPDYIEIGTDFGYIFIADDVFVQAVDTLPILLAVDSEIYSSEMKWVVVRHIDCKEAADYIDLVEYSDVKIWCVCEFKEGFEADVRGIVRDMKISKLLN